MRAVSLAGALGRDVQAIGRLSAASTQEIAASASELARTDEQLDALVRRFRARS